MPFKNHSFAKLKLSIFNLPITPTRLLSIFSCHETDVCQSYHISSWPLLALPSSQSKINPKIVLPASLLLHPLVSLVFALLASKWLHTFSWPYPSISLMVKAVGIDPFVFSRLPQPAPHRRNPMPCSDVTSLCPVHCTNGAFPLSMIASVLLETWQLRFNQTPCGITWISLPSEDPDNFYARECCCSNISTALSYLVRRV